MGRRPGQARRRWVSIAVGLSVVVAGCSGGGDGDVQAFCDEAAGVETRTVFRDFDPLDIDASVSALQTALDTQRRLRAEAPASIRSDLDVQISFLDDLITGLAATDPIDAERPPIYDTLRPRFDQVEAANDRLDLYVSSNC